MKSNKKCDDETMKKWLIGLLSGLILVVVAFLLPSMDSINTRSIKSEARSLSNEKTNEDIKKDVKDVKKMVLQLLLSKGIKPNISQDKTEVLGSHTPKKYELTELTID